VFSIFKVSRKVGGRKRGRGRRKEGNEPCCQNMENVQVGLVKRPALENGLGNWSVITIYIVWGS